MGMVRRNVLCLAGHLFCILFRWKFWIVLIALSQNTPISNASPYDIYENEIHKTKGSSADPRCERVGQMLLDPHSQCYYLVCQHGSSAFKKIHGNQKLFTRRMPCAPGTFVKSDFIDDGYHDQHSPCSGSGHVDLCPDPKYIEDNSITRLSGGRSIIYSHYPQMSAPEGKQASLPTPSRSPKGSGSGTERLRQLVELLRNIVHDEMENFHSISMMGVDVASVNKHWNKIRGDVDDMLSMITQRVSSSSHPPPLSGSVEGKSVDLLRDPHTLYSFGNRMMSTIVNVMRLTDKTDELINHHESARSGGYRADGMVGTAPPLRSSRPSSGGRRRRRRWRRYRSRYTSRNRRNPDVYMMKTMMKRLKRGEEIPPTTYKFDDLIPRKIDDRHYNEYEDARAAMQQNGIVTNTIIHSNSAEDNHHDAYATSTSSREESARSEEEIPSLKFYIEELPYKTNYANSPDNRRLSPEYMRRGKAFRGMLKSEMIESLHSLGNGRAGGRRSRYSRYRKRGNVRRS